MRNLSISQVRTSLFAAVVALASLSSAGHAQMIQEVGLKANIPFAFNDGDRVFAPGTYTVTGDSAHFLRIHNDSSSDIMMMSPEIDNNTATRSRLVFHQVGTRYFLHEVWTAGKRDHFVCVETKAEKRARQTLLASAAQSSDIELAALVIPSR